MWNIAHHDRETVSVSITFPFNLANMSSLDARTINYSVAPEASLVLLTPVAGYIVTDVVTIV